MKKIAVVAYVPAIHQGYIKFFHQVSEMDKDSKTIFYLVGDQIIKELQVKTPYYGRDIRAIDSELMIRIIGSLCLFEETKILELTNLVSVNKSHFIIMPEEDISHEIYARYFFQTLVVFLPFFLRWNKLISQAEIETNPDRKISQSIFDTLVMGKAFMEAKKSSDWWRQVGSALVKDGKIALYSYNEHMPHEQTPNVLGDARSSFDAGIRIELTTAIHSEINLISEAAKRGISTDGASIYVTTFPCPPCARAIVKSGIKKVYYSKGYSLLDAEDILKHFGVELILVK